MISVRVWLAKRAMVIKPRLVGRHVHVWYDNITCCPQHAQGARVKRGSKLYPISAEKIEKCGRLSLASSAQLLHACILGTGDWI